MGNSRRHADYDRIRELSGKGLTPTQIKNRLGVSAMTVSRALNPDKAERCRDQQRKYEAKRQARRNNG